MAGSFGRFEQPFRRCSGSQASQVTRTSHDSLRTGRQGKARRIHAMGEYRSEPGHRGHSVNASVRKFCCEARQSSEVDVLFVGISRVRAHLLSIPKSPAWSIEDIAAQIASVELQLKELADGQVGRSIASTTTVHVGMRSEEVAALVETTRCTEGYIALPTGEVHGTEQGNRFVMQVRPPMLSPRRTQPTFSEPRPRESGAPHLHPI